MDNVQIVLLCIGIAVVAGAAAGIPLFFLNAEKRRSSSPRGTQNEPAHALCTPGTFQPGVLL